MINLDGVRWGTAAEIAVQLGHGVTAAAVRSWAARDGLPAVRTRDEAGPAAGPVPRSRRRPGSTQRSAAQGEDVAGWRLEGRTYYRGMADAPNTADWLQGIGTVAAFALTGAGLLWEARARRLDRSDQDRALARGVVIRRYPADLINADELGTITGARGVAVKVENYCSEPAINVVVLDPPGPAPETISPGAKHTFGCHLPQPVFDGYRELEDLMPVPLVDYQVGGRRWARRGSEEPIPWPPRRSPLNLWKLSRRDSTEIGA